MSEVKARGQQTVNKPTPHTKPPTYQLSFPSRPTVADIHHPHQTRTQHTQAPQTSEICMQYKRISNGVLVDT